MEITENNTQFFTFFAGIKNSELVSLEELAQSFRRYYRSPLWVMDQHKPIQRMVDAGERIFFDDTAYLEHVSSDLDQARLERFFESNSDFVQRIQVPRQFPHEAMINETLNNHRSLPYAVIMDSDIWFKNGDFLGDLNELVQGYSEDEVFAAGLLIQSVPFDLPSDYAREGEKHVLHKLGDWLIKQYGFRLGRGKLPGLEPNFFWINGSMFTRLNMSYRNMRLNILDATVYRNSVYKVLGDNGPSVLLQAAMEGKTMVNIDINKYRVHEKAQATSVDVTAGERSVDWFLTDAIEWPPPEGVVPSEPGARVSDGLLRSSIKKTTPALLRRSMRRFVKKYSPVRLPM